MVFTSLTLFARSNKKPCEFWRKRKILRMTAHFKNRKQNCYSLAIRGFHRAMQYHSLGRRLKRKDFIELWNTRINAALTDFGIDQRILLDGLAKCNIFINRKCLTDLAIWEPRTFKAIADIAVARAKADGLNIIRHLEPPKHVITRGMLK